jgi:Flp pilus assembly pilin Flp
MVAWLKGALRLGRDTRAITTLEYGLIAGAVGVVAFRGALVMLGNLNLKFAAIALKFT